MNEMGLVEETHLSPPNPSAVSLCHLVYYRANDFPVPLLATSFPNSVMPVYIKLATRVSDAVDVTTIASEQAV